MAEQAAHNRCVGGSNPPSATRGVLRDMLDTATCQELVASAAAGDEAAFAAIVRSTYPDMYGLALRLLGNEDDARDVLQEAYLRAYRSLHKFRGDSAFTTWLYRITANAAYTYIQKRKKHATEQLDCIEEPCSIAPLPEEASQTAQLRRQLERHLLDLPFEQRAVVVMKDIYGLSHDAIAKELGVSATAAKVRLHRARKRLRSVIEAEGGQGAVS